MRLNGKTAVISGGASGIGFAIARRFLQEGASVAIGDWAAMPDDQAATLAALGGVWRAERVDVSKAEVVDGFVHDVLGDFGAVDILVNAAGVVGAGPATFIDHETMDRVLGVNVMGSFNLCRAVLPGMIDRGGGAIINIASIFGMEGCDNNVAYNVSKGAVIQLTRSLAIDHGRQGVRVNCLAPGYVETPMTEVVRSYGDVEATFVAMHALNRSGRPEEVAAAALFLASDDASFVSGHCLAVDGGFLAGRRLQPG